MIKILVLEDEVNTNEVICEYLKEAGYKVFSALDGEEALKIFLWEDVDLAILDIMVPKMDGIEVLSEIRESSDIPVIMLTAISDEITQMHTFEKEADEYVSKPFSPKVLVKRVEALLKRCNKIDNMVICYEDLEIDFPAYRVLKNGKDLNLTTRELNILKFLIENNNKVVTRLQILDRLWSNNYEANDRLVDTHIKNLRKKLDCDLIETVKGVGYTVRIK